MEPGSPEMRIWGHLQQAVTLILLGENRVQIDIRWVFPVQFERQGGQRIRTCPNQSPPKCSCTPKAVDLIRRVGSFVL
jgi:hypothetical protein